jgi:hypothetical protein
MNFKNQAEKLEKFLEEEFKKKTPLAVLPDKSLVYNRFKIKENKARGYYLCHINNDVIDTFYLKATAAIAAKNYYNSRFDLYNHIKNLDTEYWTNFIDSAIFEERYKKSKDFAKKQIYLARYSLTKQRAENYRNQIATIFKNSF